MKKNTRTLLACLAIGGMTLSLTLSPQALAEDVAAEQPAVTGAITGTVVLAENAHEGVNTEGLKLADAIVVVRGQPRMEPFPYPANMQEMTREEQGAWLKAFQESEEGKAFQERREAAAKNAFRRIVPINEDGSFSIEGLAPGPYAVQVVIPHPAADLDNYRTLYYHSRAGVESRTNIPAAGGVKELGEMTMAIKNVLMPGDVAPDFTATNYHGETFKLSDYRGKYVLIDFWATWCAPCKAEIPNLVAVYNDYQGDRFEMIGLSLDKTIDLPKAFHENQPSPYVHGYLGEWNRGESTARAYGVIGIPSIWLIGPDGKIVARDLRGEALREAVRKVAEQPAQN